VSVHVNKTAHFLLAQYFYHVASNPIKTYIRPAWVCMSIRLQISLVINIIITSQSS